jgi:hypothetical protein
MTVWKCKPLDQDEALSPRRGPSTKGGTVTGRKVEGREIMRDNECNSETNKKNGFEECYIAPGVRPEKGHLTPEVKAANKMTCDYVWDKLCPPPISVTCPEWFIRKAPFVLGTQSLH